MAVLQRSVKQTKIGYMLIIHMMGLYMFLLKWEDFPKKKKQCVDSDLCLPFR